MVTGALGRLGPVWTDALLGAGACVVAVDVDGAVADGRFAALADHAGARLRLVRGDVRDRSSMEAVLAACREELGHPSVLVNNAGMDQPPGPAGSWPLAEVPVEEVRAVLDVNVVGTVVASQVFGGAMAAAGRGSIVNIGSLYGSLSPDARLYDHIATDPPFLKPLAYGPSKAAVASLTRYFAAHWAAQGVRVNALSPGGVEGGQDDEFVRKFSARVPQGRLARHDELAGPLLFLASEASSYVTGIELKVDGGFSVW